MEEIERRYRSTTVHVHQNFTFYHLIRYRNNDVGFLIRKVLITIHASMGCTSMNLHLCQNEMVLLDD